MNHKQKFPNGFTSWQETHFEVVSKLVKTVHFSGSTAHRKNEEQGTGGLYELAEDLTDKFEKDNKGADWEEKSFFDTIETFLKKEL
ncbi:hypothetical protein Phi17218_147 [Cellulophaga phage phi17:2_18]|uniref:Uncharacterized protein n=2 Tax=Lightbulbvirus Cba172 TaxID=1918525 RepID=R9ZYT5_9CAUD|nr:hypothetical protein Phi17:2_gp147 [Cellulophaga phage phi17:2]AGO47680.1 hypothetical protein Phi17:2_gp147 [Cellulophaga phage phi17:2]ALO80550.1 hypothetical protein Phi17218_147 [Cellulophaga phage phi17:2_18]